MIFLLKLALEPVGDQSVADQSLKISKPKSKLLLTRPRPTCDAFS